MVKTDFVDHCRHRSKRMFCWKNVANCQATMNSASQLVGQADRQAGRKKMFFFLLSKFPGGNIKENANKLCLLCLCFINIIYAEVLPLQADIL